MDYPALIDRLSHRGLFRIKPGLNRIQKVLHALGDPQEKVPAIHIAGTNGKGSVAASLESVLRRAGRKTGLYTSPHLWDVRERIQIERRLIGVTPFWESAQRVFEAERQARCTLTYFEFLTAIAFHAFAQAQLDVAVIETGMGGRWDATNVIQKPALTVITSVGLDHTQWLGGSEMAIAKEKAGIIKTDVPLISGVRGKTASVISGVARSRRAPIFQIDENFKVEAGPVDWEERHQTLSYHSSHHSPQTLKTALMGCYQIDNAALTLAAVDVLRDAGWAIPEPAVAQGLEQVEWPGRFQFSSTTAGPVVLFDGAHNPPAVHSLIEALSASPWRDRPKVVVFSVYRDKDYRRMLKLLRPVAETIVVCSLPGPRALSARQIAKAIPARQNRIVTDPHKALLVARELAGPKGLVLATGSLTLVGLLVQDQAAHVSEYAYA